ncbi:MAG: dTMP kinase [Micrococcales bacterium]|nr:dTMP kinase [Micrococcales bacterium]
MTSKQPDGPTAGSRPPGRFLAFEGGDGAGKSTQVELLAHWLRRWGLTALTTCEPGGTPLGVVLRELLLHSGHNLSPRAEALLFAADRAQHVAHLVQPALSAGDWVITDRYVDSSIAYQGAGRRLDGAQIAQLSAWATDGLTPDLTVLLDVPTHVGAARRQGRADRVESAPDAFHEQVRQGFRALAAAAPERYLMLDATQSPEALAAAIRGRLEPWVQERRPNVAGDLVRQDTAQEAR